MSRETLIQTFVEVLIPTTDDFLKVKETLTRMGVANRKDKTLFQSCHILHKKGKYYIVHFKELFSLDGRTVDISQEDIQRRNSIATILESWGMLKIVTKGIEKNLLEDNRGLQIISFKEKSSWTLKPKYSIGNKRGE